MRTLSHLGDADAGGLRLKLRAGESTPYLIAETPMRTVYAACFCDRDIRIDGNLEDWPGEPSFRMEEPNPGSDWDGPHDLSAAIYLGYDRSSLYFAAEVLDDAHSQMFSGREAWKGDSIQIAFDPLSTRLSDRYGPEMHEIGFYRSQGESTAWRWKGSFGQPRRFLPGIALKVNRDEESGKTVYEARIPLVKLAPLNPHLFPMCGFCVTVNDCDGSGREAVLECEPGVMTVGKHPERFWTLRFEDPDPAGADASSASAMVVWNERIAAVGAPLIVDLYHRSPDSERLRVTGTIHPHSPQDAWPGLDEILVPSNGELSLTQLGVIPEVPAGKYELVLEGTDSTGRRLFRRSTVLFVHPESADAGR